jgi:hypothetical protein
MDIQYIIREVNNKEKAVKENKQHELDSIKAYYNTIAYYTTNNK